MDHESPAPTPPSGRYTKLIVALAMILIGYGVALAFGYPQAITAAANAPDHAPAHDHPPLDPPAQWVPVEGEKHELVESPKPYWVAPFVLLLGSIALLPLMKRTEHWWENNLHKLYVAGGLALVTLAYYLLLHPYPVERHFGGHGLVEPSAGGPNWLLTGTLLMNSVLGEYVPFIVLLFSLYTIAGGLRITGNLNATPGTNTAIMAVGALLASFVGTTGAAMILIRLLLETNRERKQVEHTVVFFIFIVCNAGGLLLPLGDPPLFLGYLFGVDFFWTLKLVAAWLFVNGALLAIYFLADKMYFRPLEYEFDAALDRTNTEPLRVSGVVNIVWLLGVIVCVALLDPAKALPGTSWHPPIYLREMLQLALVMGSLLTTPKTLRSENGFNFGAIIEVAALFIGIFITMQPALQILSAHGGDLGVDTPTKFFWTTGALSAVLDNAPTYAVFFDAAQSLDYRPSHGRLLPGLPAENLLAAVSLGAVLMGAMTYIGNGPNFMVRAIAEKAGVRMPSFFGYMKYSIGFLLPIFLLLNLIASSYSLWVAW